MDFNRLREVDTDMELGTPGELSKLRVDRAKKAHQVALAELNTAPKEEREYKELRVKSAEEDLAQAEEEAKMIQEELGKLDRAA